MKSLVWLVFKVIIWGLIFSLIVGLINLTPYYLGISHLANNIALTVSDKGYLTNSEYRAYINELANPNWSVGHLTVFNGNANYLSDNRSSTVLPRIVTDWNGRSVSFPDGFVPSAGLVPNRGEKVGITLHSQFRVEIYLFGIHEMAVPISARKTATTLRYYRW